MRSHLVHVGSGCAFATTQLWPFQSLIDAAEAHSPAPATSSLVPAPSHLVSQTCCCARSPHFNQFTSPSGVTPLSREVLHPHTWCDLLLRSFPTLQPVHFTQWRHSPVKRSPAPSYLVRPAAALVHVGLGHVAVARAPCHQLQHLRGAAHFHLQQQNVQQQWGEQQQ